MVASIPYFGATLSTLGVWWPVAFGVRASGIRILACLYSEHDVAIVA